LGLLIGQEQAVFISKIFFLLNKISFGVDTSHNGFSEDVAKKILTFHRTGY